MFLVCYSASLYIENSISSLLFQVFIGCISYFGVLYALEDSFLIEIKDTIIRVLSRMVK